MSLIAALREATRDQHEAIEASGWLDRATADLQAYADHLARVAAFYRAAGFGFRPYLATFEAIGLEPERRKKLPLLEQELAAIRAVGPQPDPHMSAAVPALHDLSAAIGCAYVLEGSTLGASVIAELLLDRLAWRSTFYRAYGAETGARWRLFTTRIDRLSPVLDRIVAIRAAKETFVAYETSV